MMSSGCSIRAAKPSDLPFLPLVERSAAAAFHSISTLSRMADGDVTSEETYSHYLTEGCAWVAANHFDDPVGFIIVTPFGNAAHIDELSVRCEYQRRGLGRALTMAVIEWARISGFENLTLTTFRDVPWNAPFYRSMGFRELETRELDHRMMSILQRERERGLPAEARCAMCLHLC